MPHWPDNLPDAERIKIARERAGRLIDHLSAIFALHEANAIVVYSPLIANQIPPSRATFAFRQLQSSQLLFEMLRLCALWDKPAQDRESIPTILKLLDKPEILDRLAADRYARFANEVLPDPPARPLEPDEDEERDPEAKKLVQQWWQEERLRRAGEEKQLVQQRLHEAFDRAADVQGASYLGAMRSFRDAQIAHNLDVPNLIKQAKDLRLGDERLLLRQTVRVADRLHRALGDASFLWLPSRRMARRHARALWTRCTFDIDPRA